MTDVITFSRPYAEAAYKVAVNDNTIDIWFQDMNILGKAVNCLLYTSPSPRDPE